MRDEMARRIDAWFVGIVSVSLALSLYQLDWGLPNGNNSWAADALGPVTVLSVLHHSFSTWNSGWFYFKYPPGYPLVLAASFAPYLGYLFLTGGWRHPSSTYPYGLADPEHTLFVLMMIGRLVNVAFTVGTVVVTYLIAERLVGKWSARLSALFVATAYPIVYYAHTTNLDAGYAFWLVLALYAAIVAGDSERPLPWIVLGAAAAMAVSTKEQGFAFLLPLPALVVIAHWRRQRSPRVLWSAPVGWMAAATIATMLVANNIVLNPLGFIARIAYLLGRPFESMTVRLAPVEFAWFKGAHEWVYVRQLWDGLDSALGTPLAWLATAGTVAIWRRPRAAIWLLAPAVAHYYLSLRGLDLITLRYLLPLYVVAAILAAALLTELYAAVGPPARLAVGAAAVLLTTLGLARAIDLDWALQTDSRYQAEAWLAANAAPGAHAEVYQKPVYMPRFPNEVQVNFVAPKDRSIQGIRERRPDLLVLSSASHQSVTSTWAQDWKASGSLLAPIPAAVEMIRALKAEELGYRRAAIFRQEPFLLRSRLTSICPEITIYVRQQQ